MEPIATHLQQAQPSSVGTSSDNVGATLKGYCGTCHNDRLKTAGLSIDKLDVDNVSANADVWEKIVHKLRSRTMPPSGARRPDEATYDRLSDWLETNLDRLAAQTPNPGNISPFRRLTRTEYRNAIRDLLALSVLPKEMDLEVLLPADNPSTGFDNLADLLFVSSTQLEEYVSAAQKISRLAVGDSASPPLDDVYKLPLDGSQDSPVEGLPLGTRGGTAIRTFLPLDGEYNVHVELAGNLPRTPAHLEVSVDGRREELFDVSQKLTDALRTELPSISDAPSTSPKAVSDLDPGVEIPIDTVVNPRFERDKAGAVRRAALAKGVNVTLPLKAGPRVISVTFVKEPSTSDENMVLGSRASTTQDSGIASITLKGPQSPTGAGDTPSRRRVFVCRPTTRTEEAPCATRIFSTLARRAYRRPVAESDLQPLLAAYKDGRATGDFTVGIEEGLERILVSPDFLFRIERDPKDAAPNSVHRISDVELASRLSFFLWSSIPDDELLDVAAEGRLKDPTVVAQQVRRMLADPRSSALASNFAAQWLYLRDIDAKNPSPRVFPDFDKSLIADFHRETELFLESVFKEDRNVLELLTANYTFLNERLANHYGIPGVFGPDFRRVAYPADSPRRGLLGQGSILTLTSYANRTSPVLRGKYVLGNILGSPPPPPPPNVPSLVTESKDSGKPLSMREAMGQHRANPVCASCHLRMDPIGFALDNFDAVGHWRTISESGAPIDSSGTLPDGSKFDGMDGLLKAVVGRPDEFLLNMTDQLLTYALGRSLDYHDAPMVRAIVRDARTQDYKFSALMMGIISSTPFQMRKVAGVPPPVEVSAANR